MRVIGLRHGQSEYNLLGLSNYTGKRAVMLVTIGY